MRWGRTESRRMAEIEDALACIRLDRADDHLIQAIGALRDLCGATRGCVYGLGPAGAGGLRVDSFCSSGMDPAFRETFDDYLADKVIGWTGFNPLCPEPWQRNVALDERDIRPKFGVLATEQEFYPRVGMRGYGTTRILLCDGPQLMAYLGMFDQAPSIPRTKRILNRLRRAFHRRMRIEHSLRAESSFGSALEATLDQLGSAAFIANHRGRVLAMNELGRREMVRDALSTRSALVEAVRTGKDTKAFRTVCIRSAGAADSYLAVARRPSAVNATRIEGEALRLGFTARQRHIGQLLAEGHSNRSIAIRMGIAERTVEAHITAMFQKSGTQSRAALVAHLLR